MRGVTSLRLDEQIRTDNSVSVRSEEHTSELQSQSNLVCRLLLENKKPHDGNALTVQARMTSVGCEYIQLEPKARIKVGLPHVKEPHRATHPLHPMETPRRRLHYT